MNREGRSVAVLGGVAIVALLVVVVAVVLLSARAGSPGTGAATSTPATTAAPATPGPTTSPTETPATPAPTPSMASPVASATPATTVTAIAVGDIATCEREQDDAVGQLVAAMPGTLLLLGDIAYESGTASEFERCYDPTWGAFRDRTRPAPGNHEYLSEGARPYFEYFDDAAGTPGEGWYAFDLGAWRIYALNSNCSKIDGCGRNSPQTRWLADDLAANDNRCVLAYWHHPRFSSGQHGDYESMDVTWRVLYDAGADLVLNGHDHNYERFAPQNPDRERDDARGIRQFVVGTGGRSLRPFEQVVPNSQIREARAFGVLELTLRDGGYDWRFVSAVGREFSDAGSGSCH